MDEAISGLIGRIYESAANEAEWERVLFEVRERIGAHCLMQSISDLGQRAMHGSMVVGEQRRPEGLEEYKAHAFELDMSFRWATRHPSARYCDTESLFTIDDHDKDDFTRWNSDEWLGSKHWIVGYTAPNDQLTFGLSAHASPQAGTLTRDNKRLFKLLFEHLERALRLQVSPPTFLESGKAQILVDRLGYVRAMSTAARQIIEAGDGLGVWQGRLHAADGLTTKRLDSVIRSALDVLVDGGFGGASPIPRPSGKLDFLVTVTPLLKSESPFDAFRPAALLQIVDPELAPPQSMRDRLAELFEFTPAEARFVEDFMGRDQNIRHTADELGISYSTARVHLKHVLEKTGTHSQAQLSRLLARLE